MMESKPDKRMLVVQVALLVLAAGMIAVGVLREEVELVLTKAVNICMECIGLG